MATILIVGDRLTHREYLVTPLEYGGHRMLKAADGMEALAIARVEHPNLIISDILMPTMDGSEFVRQLRQDTVVAATPVIFYAAYYHEREARALADACGVSHVLTKPAELEVVLRTVNAALGRKEVPTPRTPAEESDHLRLLSTKLIRNAYELRRNNARLTALVALGAELGSEHDPWRLVETFCHAARELIGAKHAIAGILDGDGFQFRSFFTSGMDAEISTRLGSPNPWEGKPGIVLRESRCLRLQNPGGNPADIDLPPSYPLLYSWLGAPIVAPDRVYGWLCLLNKVGAQEFSDDDERLAALLTAQVGRIYENGYLNSELVRQSAEVQKSSRARTTETGSVEQLTSRQREILQLLAKGNNTKEIARMLSISVKTVETHRAHVMKGLGIHNLADLVRYAIRVGLIKFDA